MERTRGKLMLFVYKTGAQAPGCTSTFERLRYQLEPLAFGKQPKTCDAKLCRRCAKHVGPDRDLCPPHAKLEAAKP